MSVLFRITCWWTYWHSTGFTEWTDYRMCCGDCQLGAMQFLDCLCHNEGVSIFLVSVRCPRQCSVKGGNNYCIMVLSFERLRPFLRFPCCRKERKKKKPTIQVLVRSLAETHLFLYPSPPVSAFTQRDWASMPYLRSWIVYHKKQILKIRVKSSSSSFIP